MPAPKFRSDYDQLQKIASAFGTQASNAQRTLQQVKAQMETLQRGDWIGQGARAFYKEMEQDVLPSLQRLAKAIERAQQVTLQIGRIIQEAEAEAARLLRGAGLTAGAGAEVSIGPGGDGSGGAGSGGLGLPGWFGGLASGVSVASWALSGLGDLVPAVWASRTLQMARIFAQGGEEALRSSGIAATAARWQSRAAQLAGTSEWLQKWGGRLNILGAGMTAIDQGASSSAETLAGKILSAGSAGGATYGVGLSGWTTTPFMPKGFTAGSGYFVTADMAILGLNTVAGTNIDRPSQIVNNAIDTIVTTGEGLFTGSTRGMEQIHQRQLAGEHGWVFQKAAEAGDFWAEHGVGGGLKTFWNEVTGLF